MTVRKLLQSTIQAVQSGERKWPPLIELLWYDAQGTEGETGNFGEVGSLGIVRTAGYLANFEASPPSITTSVDNWKDEDAKDHTMRNTSTVPWDWVIALTMDGEVHLGPASKYLKQLKVDVKELSTIQES